MNVLIPMAGEGKRFASYDLPKPLIPINGKPMIQCAVESLGIDARYIFVVKKYENLEINNKLKDTLSKVVPDPVILEIDHTTQGPACTCLLAEKYINNDDQLMTANCDQIMEWNPESFITAINDNCDGLVVTYNSQTSKNSYVKLDDENLYATKFAEKEVISEYSLNGIHYWRKGKFFVDSARRMIEKNVRVNNEFYIAPTYNELIAENKRIKIFHLENKQHWAVGVPEDLDKYLLKFNHEKI
tara:strand:- start:10422 stop:11150 length:729 start_codon:yes stop_codon:yes gene_type:complete